MNDPNLFQLSEQEISPISSGEDLDTDELDALESSESNGSELSEEQEPEPEQQPEPEPEQEPEQPGIRRFAGLKLSIPENENEEEAQEEESLAELFSPESFYSASSGTPSSTTSRPLTPLRKEVKSLDELYSSTVTVGRGRFGEVVLATRRSDGKVVAVKIIDVPRGSDSPGLQKLVARELEIIRLLSADCQDQEFLEEKSPETVASEAHDVYAEEECGVAPVYQVFYTGHFRRFFIEMKYISGGNGKEFSQVLHDYIHSSRSPGSPVEKPSATTGAMTGAAETAIGYAISYALRLFIDNFFFVVSSLYRIHQYCVIHRDIKPQNMLFDSQTQKLLLSDFGISCFKPQCSSMAISGTIPYLDPTVVLYGRGNDEWSDVYSLGLVFFEMLYNAMQPEFLYKPWVEIKQGQLPDMNKRYEEAKKETERMNNFFRMNLSELSENQSNLVELQFVLNVVLQMMSPFEIDHRPALPTILAAQAQLTESLLRHYDYLTC